MSVIRKELGAFIALAALPAVAPTTAAPRPLRRRRPWRMIAQQRCCRRPRCSRASSRRSPVSARTTRCSRLRDLVARRAGRAILADHYVDAGGQGLHLTVFGASCDGGGLNLSAPYNDAISSTVHGLCGRIKHFSEANAGGDNQITMGGTANMNPGMNDRTSSIYYYVS